MKRCDSLCDTPEKKGAPVIFQFASGGALYENGLRKFSGYILKVKAVDVSNATGFVGIVSQILFVKLIKSLAPGRAAGGI